MDAKAHSLPSTFSAIVNLRKTVREFLEAAARREHRAAELRYGAEIRSNPTFLNHLEQLAKSREVGETEIGYSLDFSSRTLKPLVDQNGAERDTVVCTVAFGEDYRRAVRLCLDRQRAYCRQRGYDYAQLHQPPSRLHRHPSWHKIPLVHALVRRGYRKIFFIDADALITNPEITLDAFFERLRLEKKAIHLAEDDDGVNMGVFFMNNSPDAIRLLDLVWLYDLGAHRGNWEQAALKDLLNQYPQVRQVVSIAAAATAFNSFPAERASLCHAIQENEWKPGDFICHFSGIPSPILEKLIAQYVA